jgi:hypothetical protein
MSCGDAVLRGQLEYAAVEHEVGQPRPAYRADHLDDGVGKGVTTRDASSRPAAEQPVGGRHDGVEVGARNRAEHQYQHRQAEYRRSGVLQQLQPHVVGGQLRGGDSGANHHSHEQGGADELREESAR